MTFEKIQNKIVLLRCDFNEPIKNNILQSTKRVDANVLTINELLARKNKVILLSHHSDKNQTMLPVFNYLQTIFQNHTSNNIKYINTTNINSVIEYYKLNGLRRNSGATAFQNNSDNLFLLENTRLFFENKGDEKNLDETNDSEFAKFLASLGDCFVYDAFSVGHRDHASTTGISKLIPSCFGPTFQKEYSSLKKITDELSSSVIFMGGAKLSTKLPLIEKFLSGGATVCAGGAMIHPILKSKGEDIKDSYIEEGVNFDKSITENKNLVLPVELIWQNENKIVDNLFDFKNINKIIVDKNIKNMMWNGPVGMYENGSTAGTSALSTFVSSNKKLFTVVGGGDTITFLEEQFEKDKKSNTDNFEKDFSYVSLSGGAMLEFLSTGTLPILQNIVRFV